MLFNTNCRRLKSATHGPLDRERNGVGPKQCAQGKGRLGNVCHYLLPPSFPDINIRPMLYFQGLAKTKGPILMKQLIRLQQHSCSSAAMTSDSFYAK